MNDLMDDDDKMMSKKTKIIRFQYTCIGQFQ